GGSLALVAALAVGCAGGRQRPGPPGPSWSSDRPLGPPTPAEAEAFIRAVNDEYGKLDSDAARASWVKSTYITDDTEKIEAQAQERLMELLARKINEARRFDGLQLSPDVARLFYILRYSADL